MAGDKIKVFYIINSMALGGAERQMAELVRRLPGDRFEPVLCSLSPVNDYAHLLPEGQPRYVLKHTNLSGIRRLQGYLQREKPDIVHSFMERSNFWSRLLAPSVDSPVVITSVRSRMMRWDFRMVEALLARRSDVVVVNSIGTRDELVRWIGVPSSKVRVIKNIADFERFKPQNEKAKNAARQKHGLTGLVVLVPGRIAISKHQLGLILAVGRLKKRGLLPDDVTFVLAGRVWDKVIERLLPLTHDFTGTVHCFRYMGKVGAIEEMYAAADWVMLPSLYEGLPNAALEAHLSERPLLMSHSANLDGIMEDGATGFEFATGWIEPMAQALARAVRTPAEEARAMGRAGRRRVLDLFDPQEALQSVLDMYDELLEKRRVKRGRLS